MFRRKRRIAEFEAEQEAAYWRQDAALAAAEARQVRLDLANALRERLRPHTIAISVSATEARALIEALEKA